MVVDYLVIGQGIAGTLLSLSLLKAGKTVMVIDEVNERSASRIAGGIINPVTGKRLVRSWMTEQLLPFAWNTYREIEQELNTPLVQQCNILDFHFTEELRNIFNQKLTEEKEYLQTVTDEQQWSAYFRYNYGIGEIAPCLLVDIRAMTDGWRKYLIGKGALREGRFDWADCKVKADEVVYKDIRAKKIIFCEGAGGEYNPYFKMLPWSKDKGEALIVSIPGLPRNYIFKQGISIAPWGDNLWWIGATHDWKYTDLNPTPAFRKRIEEQLDYWLKLPYTIVDHIAAQRPANMERKPFVGLHPVQSVVGILNGMGGKGVSLAPWFADELARHLVNGAPIAPGADVRRFANVLMRKYG